MKAEVGCAQVVEGRLVDFWPCSECAFAGKPEECDAWRAEHGYDIVETDGVRFLILEEAEIY